MAEQMIEQRRRELREAALWHRETADLMRHELASMTPEHAAAVGTAYVRRLQADADTHAQLASELETRVGALGDEPGQDGLF